MTKKICIAIVLLQCCIFCHAQEKGCFVAHPGNSVELVTTINFNNTNVFFIGEFHGVYGVPEIKLAMIKYLNKNFGITDVFMEMGYSAAYLYNSFLETGDTAFITRPQLIYAAKKPDMDFWTGLYEYNKGLQHKIIIRGVDFERMDFLKVLKLLMPAGIERPKEISGVLHYIDTVQMSSIGWLKSEVQKTQDSVYELIRADLDSNRKLYKQYFGDNCRIVKRIMLNENTFSNFSHRNNAMYQNIIKQVEQDDIKKFVVFSGLAHANKEHKGSVYGLLARNKRFKNKFADIAMACKNCYDWQQPQNGIVPFKAPYTYYLDSLLMNNIFNAFFNAGCKYTLIPAELINDHKVSKYSDYIILMKDQPEY